MYYGSKFKRVNIMTVVVAGPQEEAATVVVVVVVLMALVIQRMKALLGCGKKISKCF